MVTFQQKFKKVKKSVDLNLNICYISFAFEKKAKIKLCQIKKINKKVKKSVDFEKLIWYISSALSNEARMIFENWAKCQFTNS